MERSFLFDKIAEQIKLFEDKVSLAGVYKAPEEILKATTSWVLGTYCAKILELVEDKKEKYQMKKRKFELNFASFEKIFNLIVDAKDEDPGQVLRDCAIIAGGQLQLPQLDYKGGFLVEIPQEGLYGNGIWLEQAPAGEFFIEFNLIFVNEALTGSIQTKYSDALKFFKSKIGLLSQYRYIFKKFVERYEDESPDFDEEMVEYLTKNAKWSGEDRKMFKVPAELINVKNVSGITELSFACQLEMLIRMEGYAGLWERNVQKNGYLGVIKIVGLTDIPYSLGRLQERIDDMRTTTRHEIDHCLGQDGIKLLTNSSRLGGLPGGSMRDKDFDDHGIDNEVKKYIKDLKDGKSTKPLGKVKEILIHPLRDVEYTPRLNDSIHRFKQKQIPPELLKTYMKYYVDEIGTQEYIAAQYAYDDNLQSGEPQARDMAQDEFFKELKKTQPLKWRQAVKDFYKEIMQ